MHNLENSFLDNRKIRKALKAEISCCIQKEMKDDQDYLGYDGGNSQYIERYLLEQFPIAHTLLNLIGMTQDTRFVESEVENGAGENGTR